VFIIGSPRSGTSAVAWAIAQHADFWTSGETDFLYHLFGQARLESAWVASRDGWLGRHGVDRSEFMASVGLGMNAMLSKRSGGRRWVDQSPTYTAMLDVIPALFPDALFIHIMRDGRNVVESMINSGFATPWAADFAEACKTWAWFVDQAVAFGVREPERYLAVPYEFLTESPRECFAGVLEFLDAEYSEGPAEFIATKRINSSFQPDGPRDNTYLAPVRPWDEWSKQQRKVFVELAGSSFVKNRFGTEADIAV
jgi:hypothetical protein